MNSLSFLAAFLALLPPCCWAILLASVSWLQSLSIFKASVALAPSPSTPFSIRSKVASLSLLFWFTTLGSPQAKSLAIAIALGLLRKKCPEFNPKKTPLIRFLDVVVGEYWVLPILTIPWIPWIVLQNLLGETGTGIILSYICLNTGSTYNPSKPL